MVHSCDAQGTHAGSILLWAAEQQRAEQRRQKSSAPLLFHGFWRTYPGLLFAYWLLLCLAPPVSMRVFRSVYTSSSDNQQLIIILPITPAWWLLCNQLYDTCSCVHHACMHACNGFPPAGHQRSGDFCVTFDVPGQRWCTCVRTRLDRQRTIGA